MVRSRTPSELTVGLKAQYWLGVVALKEGDHTRARTKLYRALSMGPLTWYGRLAIAPVCANSAASRNFPCRILACRSASCVIWSVFTCRMIRAWRKWRR